MSGTKKMNRTILNKYVKNWNMLDTVIYFIELFAARIKQCLYEETKEPAIEEIIDAETQYLQDEITYYRGHQRPGRIVEQQGTYCCPECSKGMAAELIDSYKIKYCPECGKRIVKHQPLTLGKEKEETA